MAELEQVVEAVQATLKAAIPPKLFVYPQPEGVANLPAIVVVPTEASFVEAMGRGTDLLDFDLLVLVGTNDLAVRQRELRAFLSGHGPRSIRQAIWNSRTAPGNAIGLTGTDAWVSGWGDYGDQALVQNIDHIGARVKLRVSTRGRDT